MGSKAAKNRYYIAQKQRTKYSKNTVFVGLNYIIVCFFKSKCRLILHGERRRGDKTGAIAAANGLGTKQEHHGHKWL